MIVEVCANSFQSAINAQAAGAHRIELCAELAVGGITPSFGLIKKVLGALSLPVHVLVRPRSGDFTYSKDEFEIIKEDIELCKQLGCAGIVSGVLNTHQGIDVERTQQLIALSRPLSFTFHRAFDWVPDPALALNQLMAMGANRILTSGQQRAAILGLDLLKALKHQAKGRIELLPGGGINPKNATEFKAAGFSEIHVSASEFSTVMAPPKIPMNSPKFFNETIHSCSSKTVIEKIIKALETNR